ncbi:MAG TPA: hypothetical protein VMQ65_09055 [Candidatus Limnocylindria bacterium]|nr:hypothetical protein [Candidatus Limnocylindria bacterium]
MPRGTPSYEAKLAALPVGRRQTLELVEELILSDRDRVHARRTLADGTTFDLTAFDEFGVLVSYRSGLNDQIEFIDFRFYS